MDFRKFNYLFTGVLVLVGALNWGLIGALDFNLVNFVFGGTIAERLTYILVGISSLYQGAKQMGFLP